MKKNDIGKKYNYLTVLDVKKEKNKKYWLCKCSLCGSEKWIRSDSVTSGKQKSCGCLQSWNFNDLTNKKFGRLTAIDIAYKENGAYYWNCICECGNKTVVRGTHLTSGDIKSCGCIVSERSHVLSEIGRKAHCEKNIKDDTNLSIISRTKTMKHNTSGYTGISWCSTKQKWRASICFQSKAIHLGYYDKKEDAIKARQEAEELYFKPVISKNNNEIIKSKEIAGKKIDTSVIGKKFNHLTVIDIKSKREVTKSRTRMRTFYLCRCDCGTEKWIDADKVKNGRTKSCGCIRRENLIGQKFGMLTVVKLDITKKDKHSYWICKCDCGNETTVRSDRLKNGKTTSCGCVDKGRLVGQKFGKLTVLKFAYSRNGKFYWTCKCDCGNMTDVPGSSLVSGNIKSCGCARIEAAKENIQAAINYNKENMFVEDTNLHLISRTIPSKANTSGHTGVSFKNGKWSAFIEFQGTIHNLGTFDKKEGAIKARENAEELYFHPVLEKYKYKKERELED